MQSKLYGYQNKIQCYSYNILSVSIVVFPKPKPIIDTHKMKRTESKHTNIENHQFTMKGNRARKEQGSYKLEQKQ